MNEFKLTISRQNTRKHTRTQAALTLNIQKCQKSQKQ